MTFLVATGVEIQAGGFVHLVHGSALRRTDGLALTLLFSEPRLHVPNVPARMAATSQPDWSREIAIIGVTNYSLWVAADQFGHLLL
jgi:hypothetical protein